MVGNDVVDLLDPQSQENALTPRWDSRVFIGEELETLRAASDRHALRWSLWAAKESAFKAAHKLDTSVWFQPRAFHTRLSEPDVVTVTYRSPKRGEFSFNVQLEACSDWIHAVALSEKAEGSRSESGLAWLAGSSAGTASDPLPNPSAEVCASAEVRALAAKAVGAVLSIDAAAVQIISHGGVPRAISAGRPLPVDLSLSHHGRFIAYALCLTDGDETGT